MLDVICSFLFSTNKLSKNVIVIKTEDFFNDDFTERKVSSFVSRNLSDLSGAEGNEYHPSQQ
jgi:hypothetical protein